MTTPIATPEPKPVARTRTLTGKLAVLGAGLAVAMVASLPVVQPAGVAAQDPNILRFNVTNETRAEEDRGRESAIQYTVAPQQGGCEPGVTEPRSYTVTLQGEARRLNPTGLSETFSDFDLRCNYQLTFGVLEGHCDPMAKIRVQHWDNRIITGYVPGPATIDFGHHTQRRQMLYQGIPLFDITFVVDSSGNKCNPPSSARPNIDLQAGSDSGHSNSDNVTGVSTPVFDLTNLVNGATVSVTADWLNTRGNVTQITKTFTANATVAVVGFGLPNGGPGAGGTCDKLSSIGNWSVPTNGSSDCSWGLNLGQWTVTVTQTEPGKEAVSNSLTVNYNPEQANTAPPTTASPYRPPPRPARMPFGRGRF